MIYLKNNRITNFSVIDYLEEDGALTSVTGMDEQGGEQCENIAEDTTLNPEFPQYEISGER
jgi:hypothetical protein